MWDLIVSVPGHCLSFYLERFSYAVCSSALYSTIIEPPRDKTNKMSVRPAKTQISLGIRPV